MKVLDFIILQDDDFEILEILKLFFLCGFNHNHNYSSFQNSFKPLHFCKKSKLVYELEEFEIYRVSKTQDDQLLNEKLSFKSSDLYDTAICVLEQNDRAQYDMESIVVTCEICTNAHREINLWVVRSRLNNGICVTFINSHTSCEWTYFITWWWDYKSRNTLCIKYKERNRKEGNLDTQGNFNNLIVHATWRPQQLCLLL